MFNTGKINIVLDTVLIGEVWV